MAGDLPIQKQKIMTENQLIDLGFKRVYIDENCDEINEELIDKNNIYYWYRLHIKNDIPMYFVSNPMDDVINDNWYVDFGWDNDYELNGFKIDSYDTVTKIIDLFKSIKLK
jgi:hypothetical protein